MRRTGKLAAVVIAGAGALVAAPALGQAPLGTYQPPPGFVPACIDIPPRDYPLEGDDVTLSIQQLLINQRISQAAIRRVNAIEAWLNAGIVTGDLCGGGLGVSEFDPDSVKALNVFPHAVTPASPRPVTPAEPGPRPGVSVITLSLEQLLINQRIAQAAVRRANALEERLNEGLTGGDVADGAITLGKLFPTLGIGKTTQPDSTVPPSETEVETPNRDPSPNLTLSATQLLINQRISQASLRRSNGLIRRLESGLPGAAFRDGSLTSLDLDPSLRT